MSINSKLVRSLNEKDVENIYRAELVKIKDAEIKSPYKVDGLLQTKDIRSLLEFKYNESLKNKLAQCNVLIQCLYYLKKFENAGDKLPTTIFVGDVNECFAIHTNALVKYLSSEIDWKIAPSEAHKENSELVQAMVGDSDILPFVYDVNDDFSIKLVIDKIKDISENVVRKVRITKHNIVAIFDYFNENLLTNSNLTTNEKANLFIQIVINPSDNYLHPKKKNLLIAKSFGELAVNRNLFNSFFSHFEGDIYSPKEKEGLTALVDRLVEDTVRRNKGEFFTPTPFVDLAHSYISETFGEDWKERFVVWDNSAGTLNLTRDYGFKELYISTLEQSDIDTANQMGYNPEAVKFQYDFLNDDDEKMPEGLRQAITSGKEILFLINPPYATANNMGTKEGDHKGGVANTKVGELMREEQWGASSQNLYAQFLYRITKIQEINKNVKIGIFCPPLFLSGSSYLNFREKFFNEFKYEKGFLFEASHFSDVAKGWGINFALFNNGQDANLNSFPMRLVEMGNNYELEEKDVKVIYNLDGKEKASDWVRKEIKGLKTFDAPQLSSALGIKQKGVGNLIDKGFGYMVNAGNNVAKNTQSVSLVSSAFSNGHGLSVIKENFVKCVSLFSSRRLISGQYANWVNWNDEYLAPNENHPDFEQFTYDSIVYSLFESKSNQSSLRQVDYKDKKWDIKNEFFWMSKDEMIALANEKHFDELYKDARASDERFVYSKLFGEERVYDKLSPDAKAVVDMAIELTKKSFEMRKLVSENHPEYYLNSWDAGYAQLKLVWKEYFKDDFNEFRAKYKALEDRMRPLVYELGFLRK